MLKTARKQWKWTLLIAVPLLLLAALFPAIRARRAQAATQALIVECQGKARVDAIETLIEKGADVNGRTSKESAPEAVVSSTPLHLCLWNDSDEDSEAIQQLVKRGADIDSVDIEGKTPLMLAVLSKEPKQVSFLISRGANVNLQTRPLIFGLEIEARVFSALEFAQILSSPENEVFFDQTTSGNLGRIKRTLINAGAQPQKSKL